jgi:AcrR family transcriptional regulator
METERGLPQTRRGRQTRDALLAAAREVFARHGYLATTTTTIAKAAGVANGSFYTHFTDKYEIFVALWHEVQEEMLHPGIQDTSGNAAADPVAAIEDATRAYLVYYRDNAALLRAFEEVTGIDERFLELRLGRARAFEERNVRGIRRLQQQGLADPSLDPELTAAALSSMVSRHAYMTFALGLRPGVDFEALVSTLTTLWVNALRIRPPGDGRAALDRAAAQLRAALGEIERLRDQT